MIPKSARHCERCLANVPIHESTTQKATKETQTVKQVSKENKTPSVPKKQTKDQDVFISNRFTDAEPLIGFDSLYSYLGEHIIYPLEHPADTIEGVVELQFVVEKDGTIDRPMVVTSLGEIFDKEAIRVIQNMPEWRPAMVNDTPIATRKQIAIQFRKKTN